jgi:nucleoside-triphosphatase THEP1
MIALVTGEIGSGKTTACLRAVDRLRGRPVACFGVLSPALLDATGAKTGIEVLDVATGERRRLAERVSGGGDTIGEFTFEAAALDWAVDRLVDAIAVVSRSQEAGLLVVDEIGPLELDHRSGFEVVLEPLADPAKIAQALIVVRHSYTAALERRINRLETRRILVNEASRESVPEQIAAAFGYPTS